MKFDIRKQFPTLLVAAIPAVYLAFLWGDLPESIPIHWNASGEVDGYGDKYDLLMLPFVMPWLTYAIFLFAPQIDPKGKMAQMGGKLQQLTFFFVLVMSVLATFIIYASSSGGDTSPSFIFTIIGVLYLGLGNYMKTLKHNYFIGLRTPWTLESESVWRASHKYASYLWVAGGALVIITSLLLNEQQGFIAFMVITAIITILPILKSYLLFKREKAA